MSEVNIIGGQTIGAQQSVTIAAVAGGGDLADTYGRVARGIHVNTVGNIVGQLEFDTADSTFTVVAGAEHHYRFKSITSATATGLVLF